ncbi:MAG: hypothetical protein LUG13_05280, partial [Oscillospiraceae bacterium]|nr:hypothetical protein [Oscillospiraceae bacterium]
MNVRNVKHLVMLLIMVAFVSFCTWGGMTAHAYSASVSSMNDFYATLNLAVTSGGDGVLDLDGALNGGVLPSPLTIQATQNATVTIRADAAHPVTLKPAVGQRHLKFNIDSGVTLTLKFVNVTLDGGDYAGGIEATGDGTLKIEGADIRNCNSGDSGGGIRVGSHVEIMQSTIADNTAVMYGGGVFSAAGSVAITSSELSGNTATAPTYACGGAVFAYNAVTVSDSAFVENTVTAADSNGYAYGGAVCASTAYGDVSITGGSTFQGNRAANTAGTASGGGVYAYGALTVNNSTLADNIVIAATGSNAYGGGAYARGATTISDSTFVNNSATADSSAGTSGGGLHTELGDVDISGCDFTDNTATSFGGGVYAMRGAVSITGSQFVGNEAPGIDAITSRGGGVVSYFGDMEISNSTFTGNAAAYEGGGQTEDKAGITASCSGARNA